MIRKRSRYIRRLLKQRARFGIAVLIVLRIETVVGDMGILEQRRD